MFSIFPIKNHLLSLLISWLAASAIISSLILSGLFCWNRLDYKLVDLLLSNSIKKAPPVNSPVTYVIINDRTYKELFKKNYLDRKLLAGAVSLLYDFQPTCVAFETIFAYPNEPSADSLLASSLAKFREVYLPFSFQFVDDSSRTLSNILPQSNFNPVIVNDVRNKGFNVNRVIEQQKIFSSSASYNVQLNEISDDDGVFRHTCPVLKVENKLYPSLALSIFLNYMGVKPENLIINWGKNIVIPSEGSKYLKEDVIVPIDESGTTYIPFSSRWQSDFDKISLQQVISYNSNVFYYGDLVNYLEGRVLFICDISSGGLNWGRTSLGQDAPLIMVQTAMLHALFENHFYSQFSSGAILLVFLLIAVVVFITAAGKKRSVFFMVGVIVPGLLLLFSLIQLNVYELVPAASFIIFHIFLFTTLLIQLLLTDSKEKKELAFENQRKKIEFEEAKKIQLSMLPATLSSNGCYDYAVLFQTADEVGGDYFDVKSYDDKNLKIVIGDATGNGLKAGVMVTVIKTLLLTLEDETEIITCFEKITKYLKILNLRLVYMCLMILYIKEDIITWSSAGMPPLYHYKNSENQVKEFILKGMPLGAHKNFPYQTKSIALCEDDAVLICSDGIIELFNSKKEMFGENRLKKIFNSIRNSTPAEVIDIFRKEISKWTGTQNISDDICIIIVKKTKN